eukprot:snap_masked-scaffold_3-processed-gene-18.43-mRNA-1 protein AED:1.00 eAED:1.00 QI:0/0/0/0/1/1/2/0/65
MNLVLKNSIKIVIAMGSKEISVVFSNKMKGDRNLFSAILYDLLTNIVYLAASLFSISRLLRNVTL